ncbi:MULTISPECIES: GntR family transcriptional regulator [Streptomyces]|uniref:GntR family transcriptional regulator n=1 Tax=Streptomyces tsukubensis (strain DSM 42081 / NBRC 108919 / NRRL 18488 / 9993) TaxID=1114943 RepID=I2N084_STRT9|nr:MULTISPECIES: GntR family transcriptional regulator [Streptomyces]AZK94649.1 GntR family transcriptional regulator [Streptomyces tsukubensis]EIF90431.1 GntR family transcriptional regulator [Streptomyces tsukubensis NRRL18488]MYS65532.1 GntR family transcriptional regulator [Streptomyces sp. SID5473]QKM69266.1 GntR family transcriptional regulator [Streptomyces tsukubensis NRRL18488]TAI42801.1 GntR family transcriptional regulator [Streptomyces tsukubensis]
MLFRIDHQSPLSLSDQVAASVRRALADGSAGPGERLPAARELATSLEINLHTVLRGYQKLRDEGLVELRRGRGAVISDGAGPGHGRLIERIHELAAEARAIGLSDEELLTLIRGTLSPDSTR